MELEVLDNSIAESIFSIFRDQTRRKILTMLSDVKMTADELTQNLEISRPAVEKHLKQMLEVGLIERRSESYPTLRYIYSIPQFTQELISSFHDVVEQFIISMKDEYTRRLENEEQMFLLGRSTKERYFAVKEAYGTILEKIKLE